MRFRLISKRIIGWGTITGGLLRELFLFAKKRSRYPRAYACGTSSESALHSLTLAVFLVISYN